MTGSIFGWISALCFGISAVPQAMQSIARKNSHGLTWFFLLLWLGGELFFLAAVLVDFGPVGWMLFNVVANTSCLLIVMWYKKFPEGEKNAR